MTWPCMGALPLAAGGLPLAETMQRLACSCGPPGGRQRSTNVLSAARGALPVLWWGDYPYVIHHGALAVRADVDLEPETLVSNDARLALGELVHRAIGCRYFDRQRIVHPNDVAQKKSGGKWRVARTGVVGKLEVRFD